MLCINAETKEMSSNHTALAKSSALLAGTGLLIAVLLMALPGPRSAATYVVQAADLAAARSAGAWLFISRPR